MPRVDIVRPKTAMVKNTSHAIRSGLFWGYIGLIDGLVNRLKDELNEPCKVIATGGLAKLCKIQRNIRTCGASFNLGRFTAPFETHKAHP